MNARLAVAGGVAAALATVSLTVGGGTAKDPPPAGPRFTMVLDGSPVHDVGELRLHMSNWGMFGSWPGSTYPFQSAPSGEWPAGSGIEHVFTGGLWVGALKNGVPAVSTAAYEFEFRPTANPTDILYRSAEGAVGGNRLPWPDQDDDADGKVDEELLDGRDNDGDGRIDEDYAAISDQMFARWYTDDQPEAVADYPRHNPLHIMVREQTYQWANNEFDDFIGFDYEITNIGTETLEDVYVGWFVDGDSGDRNTPNYWRDDVCGFRDFPAVATPYGVVSLQYGYTCDWPGTSCIGALILDHATDTTGVSAPVDVHWSTFAAFAGYSQWDGLPTNDYERYQVMSSQTIDSNGPGPRDYQMLLSTGPFATLAPGQTLHLRMALVGFPEPNSTENPSRAAATYAGRWFDLDGDPDTGAGGKETHVPWMPPGTGPPAISVTRFDARADGATVRLEWDLFAEETIFAVELLRASGSTGFRPAVSGYLSGDTRAWVDRSVKPGVPYTYELVTHGATGWIDAPLRAHVTVPGAALALYQGAPNPFRASTTITFTLLEPTTVDLSVYDVAGRHVATLATGPRVAGEHEVQWNGTDDAGTRVGTGIYFCKLDANGRSVTRKIAILR